MRFRRTPEADVSSTPCPPTQCARRGHSCRDRAIVHSSVLHQLLVAARYALEECDVSETGLFLEHWTNIDPERMARYETMYQWSAAAEAFYTPAEIGEGQAVADFGCGPGHTAIEFACRVGASGHVHALDINAEFIKRTQARAEGSGSRRPYHHPFAYVRALAVGGRHPRPNHRPQHDYLRSQSSGYV
jgi:SAM-dependent methyltransferase